MWHNTADNHIKSGCSPRNPITPIIGPSLSLVFHFFFFLFFNFNITRSRFHHCLAIARQCSTPVRRISAPSLPIMLCLDRVALAAAIKSFQVIRGSRKKKKATDGFEILLHQSWNITAVRSTPSSSLIGQSFLLTLLFYYLQVCFIQQPVTLQPKLNRSQQVAFLLFASFSFLVTSFLFLSRLFFSCSRDLKVSWWSSLLLWCYMVCALFRSCI